MTSSRVRADAVGGLTVADVMHAELATLPPTATVGEVRDWFDASPGRRLALIVDDGRYVGSLTRADVDDDASPARPAVEIARIGYTTTPDTAAAAGRDLARQATTRRVPVVDRDGRVLGVLALTTDEQFFSCRPGRRSTQAPPPVSSP